MAAASKAAKEKKKAEQFKYVENVEEMATILAKSCRQDQNTSTINKHQWHTLEKRNPGFITQTRLCIHEAVFGYYSLRASGCGAFR